jgi:DNA replication protein DnaC
MEQNEKRLQELMNSLNAYNGNVVSSVSRWKISDSYDVSNGRKYMRDERVAFVKPMIKKQYCNRIAMRNGKYVQVPETLFDKITDFLTSKTSKCSLLLNGIPGTGKTTLAHSIMDVIAVLYRSEINTNQIYCIRCKASELGEMVKEKKEQFKRLKSATVLFVDDVAFSGENEVVNDYGTKRRPFEDLLEYRYDRQMMTICTSNLTFEQFREKYGERIYSRMCEMFMVLQCGKIDYRQQ